MSELTDRIDQILANATPGPWEACTAPHPDDDKTPAEWLASCLTGDGELWVVTAPNDTGDGYSYLVPAVTGDGPKSEAHAELIAAAPELLAQAADTIRTLTEQVVTLGTDIDSVRSCWHADEGPRWTANVIEALRHSGLMDADAAAAVTTTNNTPTPTTDCPEHGDLCGGDLCCCRDLHRPAAPTPTTERTEP